MPLTPGQTFAADFELLRPLGEGGMGVVWLAREKPLARDVALKVMRPSDHATRALRFEREAQVLAALSHPSILPVLRTGEDPATGLRYFTTPAILLSPAEVAGLCDEVLRCPYPRAFAADEARRSPDSSGAGGGGALPAPLSLAALLDGGKALPEAAVLRLARDLASALAAAHAAGVLHRDVKPSNILFDPAGRALLADFGLAKFLEGSAAPRSSESLSLDESGSRKFLGSPSYAAPEAFREGTVPSPALDWYSFGAVLYEALTGERPRSLRPPSSFAPARISRRWDPFLAALLEPDPARRLADPAAILRALDRIARHPAARRRRLAARAALAGAAALLALAVLAAARLGGDSRAKAAEPAPGGGSGEAEPPPVESRAERAETAGPVPGGGSGEAEPPPVVPILFPAHPSPPRLDSVWQGDDRGPLQLLGVFRLRPIVSLEAEALAGAAPELRRRMAEGEAAWSAWTGKRDSAALRRARDAWQAAADLARGGAAAGPGESEDPAPDRLPLPLALLRLAWTHSAEGDFAAAIPVLREALDALDPLVDADPAAFAPLRSVILAERAHAEGMSGLFRDAAADLQEAGLLWARHAPPDDSGSEAQRFVLAAALGAMLRPAGDTGASLAMTTRAIEALEPFLASVSAAGAGGGSEDTGPRSLADLLAGCRYRRGEILAENASRSEAVRDYRSAADLWLGLFRAQGERYRLDAAQALGRLAPALARMERYKEAIAVWDEMRDLLGPLLETDRARYAPVLANLLRDTARAYRLLGDEPAAAARDAEAAALARP